MAYYICDACREKISSKQSQSTYFKRVYSLALFTCSECCKRFYTAFEMTSSGDPECDQNYKTENFIGCQFCGNAMACQDQCNANDNCVETESQLLHVSKNNSSAVESQIISSHESGEHSATSNIHPEVTDEKLDCSVCKNSCRCSINSLCNTAGGTGKFPLESLENNAQKKTDGKSKLCNSSISTFDCSNDERCNDNFDNESDIENAIMKQVDLSYNKCNISQATFKTKTILNVHMKKHDSKSAFICKLCEKIFTSRYRLNVHMVMHSKERSHKCNLFTSTFKLKHHLLEHLVSHSKEQSLKCEICPSTFTFKYELTLHMFTHSDELPQKSNPNSDITKHTNV